MIPKYQEQEQEYAFVYRKPYAMKMIEKGHRVFATMRFPKNNKLIVWIFYKDNTFYDDFDKIIKEGKKNG